MGPWGGRSATFALGESGALVWTHTPSLSTAYHLAPLSLNFLCLLCEMGRCTDTRLCLELPILTRATSSVRPDAGPAWGSLPGCLEISWALAPGALATLHTTWDRRSELFSEYMIRKPEGQPRRHRSGCPSAPSPGRQDPALRRPLGHSWFRGSADGGQSLCTRSSVGMVPELPLSEESVCVNSPQHRAP